MEDKYQTFYFLNSETTVPNIMSDVGVLTETIDLNRMFSGEVTRTGSFDLGEIRATALGRLLNALPIPALLVDKSLFILFVNRACAVDANDILKLEHTSFASLFAHPEPARKGSALVEKVFSARKRHVAEAYLRIGNEKIWGRLHLRSLRIGTERIVLVLIEDLTAEKKQLELKERHGKEMQKAHAALEKRVKERTAELVDANLQLKQHILNLNRAEKALKKSRDTFEALLDAITDVVIMVDTRGTFLACNPPAAESVGMTPQELIGKSVAEVFPREHAEKKLRHVAAVAEAGRALRYEEEYATEIMDNSLYPVFGSDGKVERVVVITRDVTHQKKAQELFVRTERIKALGEMAGGVAHNFNNMLQIVMGGTQLAMMNLDQRNYDEVRNVLAQILESSRFGSDTVKRLQEFAGVRADSQVSPKAVLDLSEIVSAAIEISRQVWQVEPEHRGIAISLRQDLEPGCLVAGTDEGLFQVAVNLIKNAVEALPEGGEIQIRTFVEGDTVVLTVRDNGVGIAAEDQKKIFEPFWTSKGVKGTGMGLAQNLGVIRRLKGDIALDSELGSGTTFTIRLPLAKAAAQKEQPAVVRKESPQRLTILVIDDMEAILTMLREGLAFLGHTVLTATSGQAGLDLLKDTSLDVIVCDLGMPHMNGWDVGEALKRSCDQARTPKIPFILMTGWGGQPFGEEKAAKSGVDRIIEKPVRIEDLVQIIQELLKQRDIGPTGYHYAGFP